MLHGIFTSCSTAAVDVGEFITRPLLSTKTLNHHSLINTHPPTLIVRLFCLCLLHPRCRPLSVGPSGSATLSARRLASLWTATICLPNPGKIRSKSTSSQRSPRVTMPASYHTAKKIRPSPTRRSRSSVKPTISKRSRCWRADNSSSTWTIMRAWTPQFAAP